MNKIRIAAGCLYAVITIAACSVSSTAAEPVSGQNIASAPENTGNHDEWQEVIETVHHEEEGHYELQKTGEREVVDKAAWDEGIKHWYYECTVCLFRTEDAVEINDHLCEHPTGNGYHYYDPYDGYEIYPSYREDFEVEIIHHDAETHMEDVFEDVWVVDREAYDEDVHTGVYRYIVNGEPAIGKHTVFDGETYFFSSEGIPMTGWRKADGGLYYFGAGGKMQTGWRILNGRKYYFTDERYKSYRKAERGKMMTGWANIGNRTYYFADSRYEAYSKAKEGIMLSGWKTIGGQKYYFMDRFYSDYKEQNKGILLTGFRNINGKMYYLTDDRIAGFRDWKRGILATGQIRIGGKWYYANSKGELR